MASRTDHERKPRIHITALASSAKAEVKRLGVRDFRGILALAQAGAGPGYAVTASEKMILAKEVDDDGGRFDDPVRIRELQSLLGDDGLSALVTIRGGAWFVRLLDRIDFDVLHRRKTPLYIFGFSEMTPLIAIAGRYANVVALYDLGPAFLYGGMKRYMQTHADTYAESKDLPAERLDAFAAGWALGRYPDAFKGFFAEVASILEGRGCPRVPAGRLLAGSLPARTPITITGGNLSLMAAMMGSPHAAAFDTAGKWLALEDVGELPEQADRMIAGFKLAGLLDRAEGIILGDFHSKDASHGDAVFKLLRHHLPARRKLPVVALENFGHVWPIAPLPMHREVTLCCRSAGRGPRKVTIEIPWARWAQAHR